jgi:hypothetical protein
MATRPHLSQIQSSSSKYLNLLEEMSDINSNIESLKELGINAIVNSFKELEDLNKKVGFYLVRKDETYRENPTHYFYNGIDLKMVGGRIPDEILKKTVVFYMKRYNEVGQSIRLYIPYTGYINNVAVCTLDDKNLNFKLWDGDELIDEFETSTSFMEWDVYHEVKKPTLTFEMVGGGVGMENINVNVDIIIE